MSGHFTRKMYDGCAFKQDTKQSTDPLELIMDVTKYVHSNNICKPASQYPPNSALLVDLESSLRGIDKLSSKCDVSKHPFCGPNGCLLTKDPRIAPHITPYACERGRDGDNCVISTNMRMPDHPGFRPPQPNAFESNGNGYYTAYNGKPNSQTKQIPPRQQQIPVPIRSNGNNGINRINGNNGIRIINGNNDNNRINGNNTINRSNGNNGINIINGNNRVVRLNGQMSHIPKQRNIVPVPQVY